MKFQALSSYNVKFFKKWIWQNYFTADCIILLLLLVCCVAGARPLCFRMSPWGFWETVPTAESKAPDQRFSLIQTTEQACLRREIRVPTAALLRAQTSDMWLRFVWWVVSATSKHRGALVVSVKHLNSAQSVASRLPPCVGYTSVYGLASSQGFSDIILRYLHHLMSDWPISVIPTILRFMLQLCLTQLGTSPQCTVSCTFHWSTTIHGSSWRTLPHHDTIKHVWCELSNF